jgi:hypothetical protein
MDWQPIESAPMEMEVLLAIECETTALRFVVMGTKELDGRWFNIGDGILYPFAWMPLPPPPAEQQG